MAPATLPVMENAMKPSLRTLSGMSLMLVIIPMFAGLLACMPVPIGNPERSRIDPEISGVWMTESDGDAGELYLFQPYDKRTWLVTGATIEAGPDYEGEDLEIHTADDVVRVLGSHPVGSDGITSPTTVAYKVWLTRLRGVRFMTWEAVGGFNEDGSHVPEYWFVWRLEQRDSDHFSLFMVNPEHDAFADILDTMEEYLDEQEMASVEDYLRYLQKMRPRWERALKTVARNVDDDDLYGEAFVFRRLPDELLDQASDLFKEVIEFE